MCISRLCWSGAHSQSSSKRRNKPIALRIREHTSHLFVHNTLQRKIRGRGESAVRSGVGIVSRSPVSSDSAGVDCGHRQCGELSVYNESVLSAASQTQET